MLLVWRWWWNICVLITVAASDRVFYDLTLRRYKMALCVHAMYIAVMSNVVDSFFLKHVRFLLILLRLGHCLLDANYSNVLSAMIIVQF